MGAGNSCLEKIYENYGFSLKKTTGGDDSPQDFTVGGFEHTEAYGGSVMASAKRKLIKDIAHCFADELKIPGLKSGNKTLDSLIQNLKKYVPDPRKGSGNNRIFSGKKGSQVRACKVLGKCINKAMGDGIIDLDDSPAEICNQVAEIMYSLFGDIQGEFINVRDSVKKIIKNLHTLDKFLDMNYQALISKVAASSPNGLSATEVKMLREAHKAITQERDRQLAVLKNVLSVAVDPANAELSALLKEAKQFKNLVRKIKMLPGTAKFGEKYSYVLSGVRNVAQAAQLVDEALKKVGISYKDYKSTKNIKELRDKIAKLLKNKLDKATADELKAHLKAAELLYSKEYMKDDILKELKSRKGGYHDEQEREDNIEDEDEHVEGSAPVEGGLKLDKRVKQRQELRKGLLVAFNQRLADIFEQVLTSTRAISEEVGAGKIPLSEKLRKFVQAIDAMPDIGKRYVYFALSGYLTDVQSREEREKFLGHVRNVLATVKDLKGQSGHFADLEKSLNKLIDLIQTFSKRFSTALGSLDPYSKKEKEGAKEHESKKGSGIMSWLKGKTGVGKSAQKAVVESAKKAVKKAKDENKKGEGEPAELLGGDDEIEGGAVSYPEITRLAYTLDKAKEYIIYYFRIAKVRQNLRLASNEIKEYGSDYTKIRADAVAKDIDEILEKKSKLLNEWSEVSQNVAFPGKKGYLYSRLATEQNQNVSSADDRKDLNKQVKKIKEFITNRFDAQIQMFKTAEAVDEYMKVFSDGIISNPDDIQALSRMLNQVEVISKWFTDKTGDYICAVFDSFKGNTPAKPDDYKQHPKLNNQLEGPLAGEHYYVKVVKVCNLKKPDNTDVEFKDANNNTSERAQKLSDASPTPANEQARDWISDVLPGHPFEGVFRINSKNNTARGDKLIKMMEKSFGELMVLKNITSAFIAIGDKFGGKELKNRTHMSPIQIYKNLTNYMVYSGVTLGKYNADRDGLSNPGNNLANNSMVSMTHVNQTDMFKSDQLFIMTIKAMVAKIMTVLGVYNMFKKPIDKHGLGYTSHLRLIMGGQEARPKVIPEALELYMRLPLLAEFYRAVFDFDDSQAINMIPEMDGTYAGLIEIIFDRAKHVKDGTYSETEVRNLISEINKIYMKFRGSKDPTMSAIHEFIAEINRRYGLLKEEEKERYQKEKRDRYRSKYKDTEEDIDFALEPIDENDVYPRPAPSDAYVTHSSKPELKDHKYEIELGQRQDIRKLREKISNIFDQVEVNMRNELNARNNEGAQKSLRSTSFSNVLQARREELKQANSDRERYNVIVSVINGFSQFTMSALSKPIVAFHETVVSGLNSLHAMYSLLYAFYEKLDDFFLLIKGLELYLKEDIQGNLQNWVKIGAGQFGDKYKAINNTYADNAYGGPNTLGNTILGLKPLIINEGDETRKQRGKDAILRFYFDQDKILKEVVELIYGHASDLDRLVDIRLDSSDSIRVHVDHSKLRESVISTFTHVKQTLDKFRGLLPKKMIDKYEKYGLDSKFKGSLYWIEKNLIDELLNGKRYYEKGYPTNIPSRLQNNKYNGKAWFRDDNLDRTNLKLNYILDYLHRDWKFDARNIPNQIPDVITGNNRPETRRHQHSKALSELVYYIPNNNPFPIQPQQFNVTTAQGIERLLFNTQNKTVGVTGENNTWSNNNANATRIRPLYSATGKWLHDNRRSVWVMFNRLVANYVSQVYDETNQRVYIGTLNKFANGAFNNSVMGTQYYDDSDFRVTDDITNSNNAKGVLVKSLALIIKQLMTEKIARQDKHRFLESDLAEVPLYMKERFKGNMPIFRKMFTLLQKRCDLLIMFVKGLNMAHPAWGGVGAESDSNYEKKLLPVLNQISQGCSTMIQCCNDVLDELADDPKFLELYNGFLTDYENKHGYTAFTPYSSLLYLLHHKTADKMKNSTVLPIYKMGSPDFKFMYGLRGALSDVELSMSDMPGIKKIIENHNETVDQRFKLDAKEAEKLYQKKHYLVKYLVDAVKYRRLFAFLDAAMGINENNVTADIQTRGHLSVNLVTPSGALPNGFTNSDGIQGATDHIHVYQLQNAPLPLSEILSLTESGFQKEQLTKLVRTIEEDTDLPRLRGSREQIIAYNLIDMNVVPINVHALMREVPMVNLYNYEWTFDKFVCELLREPNAHQPLINNQYNASTGKELLAKMMVHPYGELSDNDRSKLLLIIRGALGVDVLGRPKFLGDDVFNKSLFMDMYSKLPPSEMGPSRDESLTARLDRLRFPERDPKTLKAQLFQSERMTQDVNNVLAKIGNARLDTRYLRNIFWLTNLHRLLRLKMRRDLMYYDTKVVSNKQVIAPGITELYNNDMYSVSTDPYRY